MPETGAEGVLEPCGIMKPWINGLLDGSLRGVVRWYAGYHVSTCSRCRAALAALRALRERLRNLASASTAEVEAGRAVWTAGLSEELDRVERMHAGHLRAPR